MSPLLKKYTRARPQFTSKIGDKGVSISIPQDYSKNTLPNKTLTIVNIGGMAALESKKEDIQIYFQGLISKTFQM